MGKKEIMEKGRVRERGKGPSGAALTSLEGNGEGKSEKVCKWTSHPSHLRLTWQSNLLV